MAVKIIGLIIGILVLCAGLYYLIKFRKQQATAAERPKKQKELRQNTSTLNICSKATARDMAVALHTFNRVCITLICVDILFQFFIFHPTFCRAPSYGYMDGQESGISGDAAPPAP